MKLTKPELERIYRENTNEKAAKILKISVPFMLQLLKREGIKLKGPGGHNKKNKITII